MSSSPMDPLALGPSMAQIAGEINSYYSAMYLIVAGAAVVAIDVLLTLDEEVRLVWKERRWSAPKIAYLLNRYGMCAFLVYYITSVVLYELIVLWGSHKTTSIMMASGYVIVHSITVVFCGLYAGKIRGYAGPVPFPPAYPLTLCGINFPVLPRETLGIYIPAVLLDAYAFTLLLANALARPRASSQKLLDLLYSDGAVFFLTTLSLRTATIIIILSMPITFSVITLVFSGALVSTAVSRLYLRLHSPENKARLLQVHHECSEVYDEDGMELHYRSSLYD